MQDKEQQYSRYESELVTYSPVLEGHYIEDVMSHQDWQAELELGENMYHELKQEMLGE